MHGTQWVMGNEVVSDEDHRKSCSENGDDLARHASLYWKQLSELPCPLAVLILYLFTEFLGGKLLSVSSTVSGKKRKAFIKPLQPTKSQIKVF